MNTVTIYKQWRGRCRIPAGLGRPDRGVAGPGLPVQRRLHRRLGYNHGRNPIPDRFVNYLWPAIAEDHYTAGFGYAFSKQSALNFALSVVPEVSVTGTGAPMADGGNGGMRIDHSQVNWQLMYSRTF